MKKLIIISFTILISFGLFAQSTRKSLQRDTSRRYIDSIIAKYEAQGLKLYNDSMYYTAIDKYTKAHHLLDSLFLLKHLYIDDRNRLITSCNILLCYAKLNCFDHAEKAIGDEYEKLELGYSHVDYRQVTDMCRINAYRNLYEAEIYIAMREFDRAAGTYGSSLHELYVDGKFPLNGTLSYPYGINSYSCKIVYTKLGDCLKAHGDTVEAKKYYRLSTKLDSMRSMWAEKYGH